MISCTEFVLLYSELFKFLEDKEGKDGVMKYWEYISDTYIADLLGKAVEKDGIKGCWNYWNKSLNEEACDFKMTLDEENNDFSIYMSGCPSRGLINKHSYMNPYNDYCGHCEILYDRVLRNFGIELYDHDYSDVVNCRCVEHYRKIVKEKEIKKISNIYDIYKKINSEEVVDFLKSINKDTECKQYNFDNNFIVNIVEYNTEEKEREDFEFHKEHIDLHFLIEGEEKILYSKDDISCCPEFDKESDGGVINGKIDGSICYGTKQAVLILPNTLHMAGYAVERSKKIKKAILKIKV